MSEELFLRHCSPTLAGIKTGNLFNAPYSDKSEIKDIACRLNRSLSGKGIRVLPMRVDDKRVLFYVYRPNMLKKDIKNKAAEEILSERGYECDKPGLCVTRLKKMLCESDNFPHEIGLFLGYPPDDVIGFIKKDKECKMTGYWKVYGDVNKAEKLFKKYRKCTEVYCDLWKNGKTIEKLTVRG
jgi:hypothetical protein